jgi:uncharacterized protein YqeY
MIFEDLQKANIQTMKDHDKVAHEIISLVFGKAKNTAIDKGYEDRKLPDQECLVLIQKFIKELEEEKISFEKAGRAETVEKLAQQQKILSAYLPKQLTEAEIRAEIEKLEDKKIPSVMKHFKANFSGQVDMGLVSKVCKEFN